MSKKQKLVGRALSRPKDLSWDEARTLLTQHGFQDLSGGGGSSRMFVHARSGIKLRLHEPHPRKTLLPYMVDKLIDALRDAGELSDED